MEFQTKDTGAGIALAVTDRYGNEITVYFKYDDPSPESVCVNDAEYEVFDDRLQGMIFEIGDSFTSRVTDILIKAESEYEDIYKEIQREIHDEAAMSRELSSPYMTGRI